MKPAPLLTRFQSLVAILLLSPSLAIPQVAVGTNAPRIYTIDNCVNTFDKAGIEPTEVGFQYWFADRSLAEGKTVKLSVVGPRLATHEPHAHPEEEFFFVLDGTAELSLGGKTKVVGPMTSFYCPSNVPHGIRNAGDTDLRYLVIKQYAGVVDVSSLWDGSHHWYDVRDEERSIDPLPQQTRYKAADVGKIADNMLLYQRSNGGWPKNYDMMAVLTEGQRAAVLKAKNELNTTIDNKATFSQVEYLARAFRVTKAERHREAALSGLRFLLKAQYENGGWPQYFPDTSGYRRYITYNDGAMIGVMKVFRNIVRRDEEYGFVPSELRASVEDAFRRGVDVILKTQIVQDSERTVWCQQHDDRTLEPRRARTYELPSLCSMESAEIVLFLMSLRDPSPEIVDAVDGAVRWFERARVWGKRVKVVASDKADYQFHSTEKDVEVVEDPGAPPLWPRFVELGTGKSLFANRDGDPVYSLAEVERERRTGYAWYTYEPQEVLSKYATWRVKRLGSETK